MKPNLSEKIKSKAIELGFDKVGITKAGSTIKQKNDLEKWISNNGHATMDWISKRKEERGDIRKYFPNVKSVISVAMNYYVGMDQSDINSDYKFSNYAWGEDYHDILKSRLFTLFKWLKKECPQLNGVVCVDTSPVMEKVWAQKAGIGWQGKHTNLITKDYGSWVFLGELLVDTSLEYDLPFKEDLCGTCVACIEACPTQALDEYRIESEKCISYNTIENRSKLFSDDTELSRWIYGCDICQEVCPWNEKFSQSTNKKDFKPRSEIINWGNKEWENLDEQEFRKLFRGSAAKRTKFSGLKRNIQFNGKDA
jgi:epoxyqueuosine reductase